MNTFQEKIKKEDKIFAEKVCHDYKMREAVKVYNESEKTENDIKKIELLKKKGIKEYPHSTKKFLYDYSDDLYKVAGIWNKDTVYPDQKIDDSFWTHTFKTPLKTRQGDVITKIKVTNDVSNAYVWLTSKIRRKCCRYKGIAPLKHFIRDYIWRDTIKIDFIRHTKGSLQYVPIKIEEKGYGDFFKLKCKGRNRDEICNELDISMSEYSDILHDKDVSKHLHNRGFFYDSMRQKRGQFDNPREQSLYVKREGKEELYKDPKDGTDLERELIDQEEEKKEFNSQLGEMLKTRFNEETRIIFHVYYQHRLDPKKLMLYFKDINRGKRLGIEDVEDVRNLVNRLYKEIRKVSRYRKIDKKTLEELVDEYFFKLKIREN